MSFEDEIRGAAHQHRQQIAEDAAREEARESALLPLVLNALDAARSALIAAGHTVSAVDASSKSTPSGRSVRGFRLQIERAGHEPDEIEIYQHGWVVIRTRRSIWGFTNRNASTSEDAEALVREGLREFGLI